MARLELQVQREGAEAEALAALRKRDFRAALVILMREYGDALYRFCLEQTRDAAHAEDLLQTVFVQAHEALPRYVPGASLRAWLYGIARHRCLDLVEGKRRWMKVVEPAAELPDTADHAPAADAGLDEARHKRALDDCLQALPAHVRETVLLRFRGELSYDELSESLGEKPVTLRVRVARALPLLRRCLESKGVAP